MSGGRHPRIGILWSGGGGGEASITHSVTGNSSSATTTATFGFTATAGRTLVLVVTSDDYKTGDPSGWTLPDGGAQQTYHGQYVWYKVASGSETSVQYTIGSASVSCWSVLEISGLGTLNNSNGQLQQASAHYYSTPSVIATAGSRFALAVISGSNSGGDFSASTQFYNWTNSYSEVALSHTTNGINCHAIAALSYTSTGSNGQTTEGHFSADDSLSAQSETGIMLIFNVA